jgi:transposase InsO family protein
MGIRDRPISPRSPWQNGYAERLIGSIRRECIDRVVVLGEGHLCHVLQSYLQYYNETGTHLSLDKDAPIPRAVEAVGRILRIASPLCADLICDRHRMPGSMIAPKPIGYSVSLQAGEVL